MYTPKYKKTWWKKTWSEDNGRNPVHKSRKVKKCIESFDGQIKVFVQPSYSPELNPTEQVWNQVKTHGVGRKVVFGPDQLKSAVISQLLKLQKLPKIVRSFFKHPDCAYIIIAWCLFNYARISNYKCPVIESITPRNL